ncbi:protein D2-like [Sabethes cyaneus]|uniref:protein D2-like n=1 Tax=Sabethes cyaneus TaxID=53552 RepID=UPI00237E5916|nr:protein D2-like [Sabethes cyaneus]
MSDSNVTLFCVLTQLINRIAAACEAIESMAFIQRIFSLHQIIPDLIDAGPAEIARIKYPSGAIAQVGNVLTPTQVREQPLIDWLADRDSYYTLFMLDPDVPSRAQPTFRSVCHWFVGNIPGCNVNKGDTRIAFIGSGPTQDTGLHRYVFLIYKQNGKIDFSDSPRTSNRSHNSRSNFQHMDYVRRYGLAELVAGNFYQAQFDNYVPTLHAQLLSGTE